MKPLSRLDDIHLQAAIGWLELGNHLEANEELEKIRPRWRVHPDVLQTRWMIYAKAGKWEPAYEIARTLASLVPESPTVWIQQAFSISQMPDGSWEQAWLALLPAADKFPDNAEIAYELATYAAQTRRFDVAKIWLTRALLLDDSKEMKLRALDDPALDSLWKEIGPL